MEQERENNLEEVKVEMMEANSEKKYPLKWFKYIIYLQLFLNVVMLGIEGILYVSGAIYQGDAELIYLYYGNGIKVLDVLYGTLLLGMAGFALYTRMRLAKFRKNGPLCYLIFLIVPTVGSVAYMLVLCLLTQQWHLLNFSSIFGSMVGMVVAIIVNYIYFKKRRVLFIN